MEYFSQVTALAALAVVAVQSILKLNIVPVYFANKYPVWTNIVLSIIAAIVVNMQTAVEITNLGAGIAYVATISVVAAITYNMTLRNDSSLQSVSNKTQ